MRGKVGSEGARQGVRGRGRERGRRGEGARQGVRWHVILGFKGRQAPAARKGVRYSECRCPQGPQNSAGGKAGS